MNTITNTEVDPTHAVVTDSDDGQVLMWWPLTEEGAEKAARKSALAFGHRFAYAIHVEGNTWEVFA